jgi:hypothetical protein
MVTWTRLIITLHVHRLSYLMNQVHIFIAETCLMLCTKRYSDLSSPVSAVSSPATDSRHIKVKQIRASGCSDNCSAQSACDLINTARCAVKHYARKVHSNYHGRYQHYMVQQQRKPLGTASDITSHVTEHVMWPVVICQVRFSMCPDL